MTAGLSERVIQASSDPTKPAARAFAVTASDTQDLPAVVRSLWIGVGGNLSVIAAEDSDPVLLRNIKDGSKLDGYRIRRVRATGTTCGEIVGWR